jgi:flagellar hook-associated protein 1 FlgK
MSFTLTFSNATSGLQVAQTGLGTTSQNIANANTEGYSRKITNLETVLIDGEAAGVQVSSITRVADIFLIRELRAQISQFAAADTVDSFFTQMQNLFGSPGDDSSIGADIDAFNSALEAMANNPENASLRFEVVSTGETIARNLAKMAADLQTLRYEADQQIRAAVDEINAQLIEIESLNVQIARATADNEAVPDLEDRRDAAILKIAEYIDINAITGADGRVSISTRSGRTLLEGARRLVDYSPAATVRDTTTFGAITIFSLDSAGNSTGTGDIIATSGMSPSVTTEIESGKLKGLLDVRDGALADLAAQVESLAAMIRDQVNAVHNQGSGFPAPSVLTGTTTVADADAFNGTGTVRVAVVDGAGAIVNSVDLDLTALGATTMGAVAAALDAALGADATVVVTNGKLTITATNSANGIAINDTGTAESVTGRGFSHFFGLNDFFTGTNAETLAVRADIVANPSRVTSAELSTTALVGEQGITIGDNRAVQRLAALGKTQFSFAAVGGLPLSNATFTDFAGAMIGFGSVRAAEAGSARVSHEILLDNLSMRATSVSGVNLDEEMANLILLQNAFTMSARVMTTASEMLDTLLEIIQ